MDMAPGQEEQEGRYNPNKGTLSPVHQQHHVMAEVHETLPKHNMPTPDFDDVGDDSAHGHDDTRHTDQSDQPPPADTSPPPPESRRRMVSSRSTATAPLTVTLPGKNQRLLPEVEEAGHGPSPIATFCKWLTLILTFLLFLGCITFSKVSVIHMAAAFGDTSLDATKRDTLFLMLLITVLLPYGTTLLRSLYCGGTRKDRPWPSKRALAWGLLAAVCESAGITLFTLDVLPLSPMFIGVLLMNGVFFIPILLQLVFSVRRHTRGITTESRLATGVLIAATVSSVSGLALTAYFEIASDKLRQKLWEIPLSIILLSVAWCPLVQKLQLDPSKAALRELVNKQDTTRVDPVPDSGFPSSAGSSSSRLGSMAADWSPESDLVTSSIRNREKDPEELPLAWAHPQFSARWKISVITSLVKVILIPGFGLLFGHYMQGVKVAQLHEALDQIGSSDALYCFLVSVGTSFGGYLLGWAACVMGIHRAAFTAPLLLGTPLTVALIMIKPTCKLVFNHWQTPGAHEMNKICNKDAHEDFMVAAAAFLYVSQVLSVGYFLFKTVIIVMPKESQIFWLPGYNSVFLEQHLLLSRKNKQTDAAYSDPRTKAQKSRIFICTTMFRESAREMGQLLKSFARINRAKQESDRNFEAHIFLDNGVRGSRLTPFALQLVSLVHKTLGVLVEDCTKMVTPYGLRLTWKLPSLTSGDKGMPFSIHMKDNRLVKNKKRWSQIMYMSYVLDYLLQQDPKAQPDNSFILTTDADIQFTPESVELLLDLMTRDQNVGAVCSRIHPMGSGLVYWYQIYDYAIGHWLQKVANHVLGSVLCCPGCFSVYRVNAVRDVVAEYASNVDKAKEFLTKDMGEDRWFCTLLVQAGWRLEYCAAAGIHTFCPEEFDEYFKQRRRWIPSSMANQALLLQEWASIYHFNKQISMFFILYQGILLLSSVINPAMMVVIIVGGLKYALDVPLLLSTIVMISIIVGYVWICLTFSQEFQLKVAGLLTILFALVMSAVVIGIALQLVEEMIPKEPDMTTVEPTAPTTTTTRRPNTTQHHNLSDVRRADHIWPNIHPTPQMYFFADHTAAPSPNSTTETPPFALPGITIASMYFYALISINIVTALLHLEEVYCLVHGLWYLFCLPSGSLVLLIYSLCNITDRSWGTREEKKVSGFGNVSNWRETLIKGFREIFFCCGKEKAVGPPSTDDDSDDEDQASGSQQTGAGDGKITTSTRQGETGASADNMASESRLQYYSSLKRLERKHSFKFHVDGTEDGPVPVLQWLPSNLKASYGSQFLENGYEDTSFIAGMSEADVVALGVTSKAHLSALMHDIKQLPEPDIKPWVPDDVDEWLESVGLVMYRINFRRSNIVSRSHLEVLRGMSREEIIQELNITKPGHLRRLKIAIENLRYPTMAEKERAEVKSLLDGVTTFNLTQINREEHDFWEELRQKTLLPESVAFAHDLDLKEKLTELRNLVLMGFGVANAIFLILVMILFTKSEISVQKTTVIGLAAAVVFGLVLLVQFLCMIVHRLTTWMHLIARAPLRCGAPYNVTWAWKNRDMRQEAPPGGEEDLDEGGQEDDEGVAEIQRALGMRAARERNRLPSNRLSSIQEADDTRLLLAV